MRASRLTMADYDDPERAASYGKRPGTTRAELRVLSRLLRRFPPGGVLLDVPCGNGRLAPFLRGLGPRVLIGVDGSAAMAGEGRAEYELTMAGDASRLPLRDATADLVVCMRLLHHFREAADRRAILAELCRVSRGLVVVTYYARRTLEGLRRRRASARVGLRRREFEDDLRASGLEIVSHRSLLPLVREQTLVAARRRTGR